MIIISRFLTYAVFFISCQMIQVESFLSYLSNSHYKKYHSQRQLRLSDNELSLGAPVDRPTNGEYLTKQGITKF